MVKYEILRIYSSIDLTYIVTMIIRPSAAILTCSLLIAGAIGCGSPSASDKSVEGVRAALSDYVTLASEGKVDEICDKYITEAVKKKLEPLGTCEQVIGATASRLPKVDQIQDLKITIDGNTARFELANDTAEFTYVDGTWKVADDGQSTN
jgi:hypothetical protein